MWLLVLAFVFLFLAPVSIASVFTAPVVFWELIYVATLTASAVHFDFQPGPLSTTAALAILEALCLVTYVAFPATRLRCPSRQRFVFTEE